ncbi:PepSY domain-containing protein [Candidatus Nitrospira bockiana]
MRYLAIPFAVALCALTACANQENLAKSARISMSEAVRTAEASVPGGKAKETHLEQEGDRTVYEVEMVDTTNNTRTVWIDAQTGRIIKTDR